MLIDAFDLWLSTSARLWWRKLWLKKKKKPDGFAGKVGVFLFKPEEKKHNVEIVLCGPLGMRAIVKAPPGSSKIHSKRPGKKLRKCLEKMHKRWTLGVLLFGPRTWAEFKAATPLPFPRARGFLFIWALVRNLAERGAIHDLTDSKNQWVQICMMAYRASIRGDVYTPLPDFARSNFRDLDIYLRVPSDYLQVDQFVNIVRTIERVWKCRVFIEETEPGVIRIYPGRIAVTAMQQAMLPPPSNAGRLPAPAPVLALQHVVSLLGFKSALRRAPIAVAETAAADNSKPESRMSGKPESSKPDEPQIEAWTPTSIVRLGMWIRGEVGAPIELDLLDIINYTHFVCIGYTGSGKSNGLGGLMNQIRIMIIHNYLFSPGVFIDIAKEGAGMEMYSDVFRFATKPKTIKQTLHEIIANWQFRKTRMAKLGLTKWPVGEWLPNPDEDDPKFGELEYYSAFPIFVDELQALMMQKKWRFRIPNGDDDSDEDAELTIGELFEKLARELRAYGMVMFLYTQETRANKGVPTGVTGNIGVRQSFRLKDRKLALDFFGMDTASDFTRHPFDFEPGQFALELPWLQKELAYGKADVAPHEIIQQQLRQQRAAAIGGAAP